MPNLLAQETSPYLLQHADNPVDWRPWGPEALAAARAANRPVLLSVGVLRLVAPSPVNWELTTWPLDPFAPPFPRESPPDPPFPPEPPLYVIELSVAPELMPIIP